MKQYMEQILKALAEQGGYDRYYTLLLRTSRNCEGASPDNFAPALKQLEADGKIVCESYYDYKTGEKFSVYYLV